MSDMAPTRKNPVLERLRRTEEALADLVAALDEGRVTDTLWQTYMKNPGLKVTWERYSVALIAARRVVASW